MLRVSREVESTVPRILRPKIIESVPRLPARGLHTTMMSQNSEYSLRIRFDGDTLKWQKSVSAEGIIMLREFPTIP